MIEREDTAISAVQKRKYCQHFALTHRRALRPHDKEGTLRIKNNDRTFRGADLHNLTAGIFADIFAEQLGLGPDSRTRVVGAALMHDWAKGSEVKAIEKVVEETGGMTWEHLKAIKDSQDDRLRAMGVSDDVITLTSANVPKTIKGPQTDEERIIWYIDMMLSGTTPLRIPDRLEAVNKDLEVSFGSRARQTRAIIAAYGESLGVTNINDVNRQLVPKISADLAERMGFDGDPLDLPLHLTTLFEQRVQEYSSQSMNR